MHGVQIFTRLDFHCFIYCETVQILCVLVNAYLPLLFIVDSEHADPVFVMLFGRVDRNKLHRTYSKDHQVFGLPFIPWTLEVMF